MVLENHSGGATRPRKKFDDIFIRLNTIPVCDRQTATRRQQYLHLRIASRSENESWSQVDVKMVYTEFQKMPP